MRCAVPPGHHAYANRAGGFCYLNNAALAAQQLRTGHERVAILDIDVHHGNGTQAIFYRSRRCADRLDPCRSRRNSIPSTRATADETGEGEGDGFNLNLPVPVQQRRRYLARWRSIHALARIQRIRARRPGHRPWASMPTRPIRCRAELVTTAGFARMAEKIASLGLPAVIVQEGGYLTEHLADNLAMFLTAFEGALEPPVHIAAE